MHMKRAALNSHSLSSEMYGRQTEEASCDVCCLPIIERPGAISYYVTRLLHTAWRAACYRLRHSEITAFCRLLWLCAAAALDETNDSWTGHRSVTRPVTSLSQSDRRRSSISTKIGAFSSIVI